MDDVRPKPRPTGRDVRLVAIEHGLHETAPAEIFDRLAERPELGRVRKIPEQFATGPRVEEAAEREIQSRVCCAVRANGCIREIRPPVSALEPLEEPYEMGPVRSFDGRAICRRACGRGNDARARDR